MRRLVIWAVAVCGLGPNWQACASVSLSGTRLVFDGHFREAAIEVINHDTREALVQAWLSLPDVDRAPVDLPFVVAPPLVSLPPAGRHTVRILYEGVGMPMDREALLHLYILEVPRRSTAEHALSIAVRQRINLFWRPPGLADDPALAPVKLVWQPSVQVDGGPSGLRVRNPSPYHVVLLNVRYGGRSLSEHLLLAPFGEHRFAMWHSAPGMALAFQALTDYGGVRDYCVLPGVHAPRRIVFTEASRVAGEGCEP